MKKIYIHNSTNTLKMEGSRVYRILSKYLNNGIDLIAFNEEYTLVTVKTTDGFFLKFTYEDIVEVIMYLDVLKDLKGFDLDGEFNATVSTITKEKGEYVYSFYVSRGAVSCMYSEFTDFRLLDAKTIKNRIQRMFDSRQIPNYEGVNPAEVFEL